MARLARRKSSSGIYHAMMRGINKQTIFESDDDRNYFLQILKHNVDEGNFILYGYCLMDNHVHLLIKEAEDGISTAIKRISASYVMRYNTKYERCGHLFQERFKSEPVEGDGYLLTVLRYIHQNPLVAGISKDMMKYRWGSYREYVKDPIIVDSDFCLSIFSPKREKANELFIKYMNEKNDDLCLEFDELLKLTDSQVIDEIKKLGVKSISDLQKLEKAHRDKILIEIKKTKGVTIRQVARITGISKSVIGKLR